MTSEFAFIGRNIPSKGLGVLVEVFSRLCDEDVKLHVFSDVGTDSDLYADLKSLNVFQLHGWVEPESIWSVDFDFVILPMEAPETYCFSLHDAVKNRRGVIVNGRNQSLCSQIKSGAYRFDNAEELERLLAQISKCDSGPIVPVLGVRRPLWERF